MTYPPASLSPNLQANSGTTGAADYVVLAYAFDRGQARGFFFGQIDGQGIRGGFGSRNYDTTQGLDANGYPILFSSNLGAMRRTRFGGEFHEIPPRRCAG